MMTNANATLIYEKDNNLLNYVYVATPYTYMGINYYCIKSIKKENLICVDNTEYFDYEYRYKENDEVIWDINVGKWTQLWKLEKKDSNNYYIKLYNNDLYLSYCDNKYFLSNKESQDKIILNYI